MTTLVFSMDKAGSTTVMNAVKSAGLSVGRLHRNNLHDIRIADYTHHVAMCREPIAKAISTYWEAKLAGIDLDIKEEVQFTLDFFENYVRPVIGVNVLDGSTRFDRKTGWTIYSGRLLVVKMEDFDTGLADGLSVLLGHPPSSFDVQHKAIGDERFGPEYAKFKEETKFDQDYLLEVYDSPYATKFFYVKELKGFLKKWKK